MKHMKQFTHIDTIKFNLTRVEADGKRFYVTPEGERYPSVTTVTGWAKREFFAKWRKENPVESARACTRGNRFHSLVENYLNNELPERSSINFADLFLFSQAESLINRIDNIHLLETSLWSNKMGLAGRVDCIAEFDGKLSVIDFKSAGKEKSEKDITEYFMQATAYAVMYEERYGIPIDNIVILISSEDGMTQLYQKNPKEFVPHLLEAITEYMNGVITVS